MSGTCFVPLQKIEDYLLNPEHISGSSKSTFFRAHGFDRTRCEELAAALIAHFEAYEPARDITTRYGRKLVVIGPLRSPDGRSPVVKSVWIASPAQPVPSLVTAMPSHMPS